MTTISAMLNTYPRDIHIDPDLLAECIGTDLDCADICQTTGRVLSRHSSYDANITRSVLQTCATACKTCADECEQHADMHEHCQICAAACRRCEDACNRVLTAIGEEQP